MSEKHLKICFIGEFGVGKTCLIRAFVDKVVDIKRVQTTLGIDFFSKTISIGSHSVNLRIWDTAGSERYRSLMHSYLRGSSIVVLVYDLTDCRSMHHVQYWMKKIESHHPQVVAVIGNKMDLETNGTQNIHECVEPWQRRDWKIIFGTTTARRKEPIETIMNKCIRVALDVSQNEKKVPIGFEDSKKTVSGTCCA